MTTPYEPEYPWGTCQDKDCATIEVRCEWGLCKTHCTQRHVDSTGTKLHAARSPEEEARARPSYVTRPPRLVATHRFLEEVV